jgi:hypothetical protein
MKDYTLKSAASERELMRIDKKPRYEELKRMIDAQKKREKGLVSLRIDKTTVILVKPENATQEYARSYDERVRRNRYIYRGEKGAGKDVK